MICQLNSAKLITVVMIPSSACQPFRFKQFIKGNFAVQKLGLPQFHFKKYSQLRRRTIVYDSLTLDLNTYSEINAQPETKNGRLTVKESNLQAEAQHPKYFRGFVARFRIVIDRRLRIPQLQARTCPLHARGR